MKKVKSIDEACRILHVGETATIAEIQTSYRKLALRHHPDRYRGKNKAKCEGRMKRINQARDIILQYCSNYEISFSREDIKKTSSAEAMNDHLRRFYDGWWGKLDF